MSVVRAGLVTFAVLAVAALAALAPGPARAQASITAADTLAAPPPGTNALRTLGEITFINLGVWSYNRYIRPGGGEGFKLGWTSWNESFENGFDWDPNNFDTNQYAHPYHGGLYYNAARSNGFDYWGSMGFSFLGSFQWEFLGESRHPSFNDWVNTSLGGVALGEMTHRLASRVRAGKPGFWKEFGGVLIDPAGGLTRAINGDMFRGVETPDRNLQSDSRVMGTFGVRTIYEESIPQHDTTSWYANFRFHYGDPFQPEYDKPYDVFSALVRLNGKDVSAIGQVSVAGLLARKPLASGARSEHMLVVNQNYDYLNNRAFQLGGQSVSTALLSRFGEQDSRYRVSTNLGVFGILLGATKSDYENQTGRGYDYGPGFGAHFSGALLRDDWDLLRVSHTEFVIHSVNGNRADHAVGLSTIGLSLPLARSFVLDGEYSLYHAERHYADFPDVSQRSPELLFGVRTRL
jgi:hypothetical protein